MQSEIGYGLIWVKQQNILILIQKIQDAGSRNFLIILSAEQLYQRNNLN
ncbi:hypothetical protein HOLDEFILI_02239 [Holdemania filiformis DSM 12042]|uniref:Uncharacterized protein n=1 Tax=Holdemania filiformis DSM 12042 TaxID=545696 RepID=B9Y8T9_9FIRM|nr:hypothetical protein HOLDEFILI_02239 [Holdemania filiformis DSM 12042]